MIKILCRHWYPWLLLLLVVALTYWQYLSSDSQAVEARRQRVNTYMPDKFFNAAVFYSALDELELQQYPELEIKAAVIPHHLVPGYMIAGLMSQLSKNPPQHVILIGPNHYEVKGEVITASSGWLTPFGKTNVNHDLVEALESQGVVINNEAINNDHSVSGLAPFINYYLPEAELTPIILSSNISTQTRDQLITLLAEQLDDETVLIASVDFSHYLTSRQTISKDEETWKFIQQKDYNRILRLGNDHLDSPNSLVTLMRVMDLQGTDRVTVMDHNNSGTLMNRETGSVTSYFWLVFN